ncbi:MAG: tetratricopeptide repeat protein [Gemmatimonadota bacterium]|nr:tetratricopeptide repeat protein [Gemmatimonadota bacterium]
MAPSHITIALLIGYTQASKMPQRLSTILLLTAAAAVAVAVVVSLRQPSLPSAARSPHPAFAKAADGRPEAVPDRGNVSHEFRAEVAALEARLTSTPSDTAALVRLGSLLLTAHQPATAIPYLERYTAINPTNWEIWLQLVTAYGALNDWDKALEATMAMLAIWPNDPEAMYNVGAIHANQGEYQEARRWWERVRDQGTDSALANAATASLRRLPNMRP